MPELTYTAEDLLKSIRNSGMIPNTGATGSEDADLLRHASEGIASYIVAGIDQLREQYYYWRARETVVSGTADYRIPARAMWDKLANVWFINSGSRIGLHPIPKSQLGRYSLSRGGGSGVPAGYTIEGQYLKLVPDESSAYSGEIEWNYFVRPGNLVKSAEYRRVSSVTSPSIVLDSAVPSTWTTANTFDVHSKEGGCDYKAISLAASVVSGTTLTFTTEVDGSVYGEHAVAAGDYVCLENTVALPGVPPELFPQVARLAAMHWAESTGDSKKFAMHGKVVETFLRETFGAMEVRVEEEPMRLGTKRSFLDYQGGGYW